MQNLNLYPKKFPDCVHFNFCSGCQHRLNDHPPLIWEDVVNFFQSIKSPILHQGSPTHWRHRAKVAVRGTSQNPLIGLFKEKSHDVVSIPDCLVHHPLINKALALVKEWIQSNHITPYQELTKEGDLRYLQGVVERHSNQVQLTFIINCSKDDSKKIQHWKLLLTQLIEQYPSFWHSIWLNLNSTSTNTIMGEAWEFVWGRKEIWEYFDQTAVCYGPASFGQANLPLFEQMLRRIKELVLDETHLVEFYAGVGAIGLNVIDRCKSVVCCEINPFAESYFKQAYSQLNPQQQSKIKFLTCATEAALVLLDTATTLIVDPPRKGLDLSFFEPLRKNQTINQLIYISCGWNSFKKDTEKLLAQGWSVANIEGYVFFPGSNHIEMLANFIR